ncbi:hypothetical protein [Caulobacter phage Cr30]|uniref:hypothetical protein n=1 Tax=Caulobacter phage Cr30 TaxID=1357714 RepID=UPI0004A9B8F3|nr:hypothetical protein OZ74_gp088 [Caulobacter phage Cr30]AGS80973.1 hypothetical protein [Caulobacter phage Cr30]
MSTDLYILYGHNGIYSDYHSYIVAIYDNKEAAVNHLRVCNQTLGDLYYPLQGYPNDSGESEFSDVIYDDAHKELRRYDSFADNDYQGWYLMKHTLRSSFTGNHVNEYIRLNDEGEIENR